MPPHAQEYLEELILDKGLPEPMLNWGPLPDRWNLFHYSGSGAFQDSSFLGDDKLVTETIFRNAQDSTLPHRLLLANNSVDMKCPFFYFEVSIQVHNLCDAGWVSLFLPYQILALFANAIWRPN